MLRRKMLRDIKGHLTQFISIFIMAMLGVFVFSGISATNHSMKSVSKKYYDDTNLADYWVYGEAFSKEDINAIKNMEGVENAIGRLSFDCTAGVGDKPILRIHIVEEASISLPEVVEGSTFDTTQDGIWLDIAFAKAYDLNVGDTLAMENMGLVVEKKILGLIIHPEFIHNAKDESIMIPDPRTFGFVFMPRKAVEPIEMLKNLPDNQVLITTKEAVDKKSITSRLEEYFSNKYVMIIKQNDFPSIAMFHNEYLQIKAIECVFPIVFFLIAALTMLTTMTRLTTSQRTQIGTLKAMGFSDRKILIHYLSYGIWLGLIGGIFGLFTGPLVIAPIIFDMQKALYTLPKWPIMIHPVSVVAVVAGMLCCSVSSYLACHKQLKEVPASCLRPQSPKVGRRTKSEKSKIWHKMGFSTQWNLRDVMRNRIRSLMAIFGVLGASALLLFGLGLQDTVKGLNKWMYEDLSHYETKLILEENISEDKVNELQETYLGQIIQESNIELKKDSIIKNGTLTVLGEGNLLSFKDKDNNEVEIPNSGIAISYKMAKILGVSKGDTFYWRIYGEKSWKSSKVEVIYQTAIGQGITISQVEYEALGYKMKPTALLLEDAVDVDVEGVESVETIEQMKDSMNQLLESMNAMVFILVLASIVLGSVVLYNLGILAFTERTREFATLKVLGFFPKQIRNLMLKQNVWMTLIGIALGIPAGYFLIGFLLSTMPDNIDMRTVVQYRSWIITIAGTFLLSIIVNLFLSRKINDIDMVSSLKSVE